MRVYERIVPQLLDVLFLKNLRNPAQKTDFNTKWDLKAIYGQLVAHFRLLESAQDTSWRRILMLASTVPL